MIDAAFWSVTEPAVAIINACIPTMRPLLKIISPSRLWSAHKASAYGTGAYGGKSTGGKSTGTYSGNTDSTKAFERMQDGEYPLTQFAAGGGPSGGRSLAVVEVSRDDSSDGGSSLRREEESYGDDVWHGSGRHGIIVKTDVDVQSKRLASTEML